MAELLTVPLTATAKARILRLALRCDSGVKVPLLDRLYEADKPVPTYPPYPVLLLEHCTRLATMMRTYQLAAAHLLEQRHLITHWGARLSNVPPPPPCVVPRGGGRHLVNPKFFAAAHCVVVWVAVLWGTTTCIPCTHGRTFCSLLLKWNLTTQPCFPLGRMMIVT